MIKTILTIQEKCDCECHRIIGYNEIGQKEPNKLPLHFIDDCKCKGTGTQTAEIYDLRDFEKCDACNYDRIWFFIFLDMIIKKTSYPELCKCKGTGYKIPKEYEPYEIKKVSEILTDINKNDSYKAVILYIKFKKHNLKEDDKLMVRRR